MPWHCHGRTDFADVRLDELGPQARVVGPPRVEEAGPRRSVKTSGPRLKNNRYAGLFRAYAYPTPYPEYPDPLKDDFFTVAMTCRRDLGADEGADEAGRGVCGTVRAGLGSR